MKKSVENLSSLFTPLLIIVLSLTLVSFTPHKKKKKVRKVKIEVKNGELKINKADFINPWALNRFIHAIGEQDRIDPGINDIYTYDKLGMILYKSPNSEEVSDFNIYVGNDPEEDYDFVPKGLFKGVLTIEGYKITAKSSLEEVMKNLPEYNFTKSIIGAWRGEYKNLYIYIQYDESEKNIYWFSFGIKD